METWRAAALCGLAILLTGPAGADTDGAPQEDVVQETSGETENGVEPDAAEAETDAEGPSADSGDEAAAPDRGGSERVCRDCCPGALRCGSSTEVLVCSEDGRQWIHFKTCKDGFRCKGTNCVKFEDTGCSVTGGGRNGGFPALLALMLLVSGAAVVRKRRG